MRFGFVDWERMYREAAERLKRFGIDVDVKRRMEETTVAERQMIEIARALFADASVVILDEPTAPLPKHDVARLFGFVRRLKAQGASFIYISHYLEEIFEVCDRVTVMRNGRVTGSAPIGEITQPELIRLISGVNVERYRRPAAAPGQPVLQLQGLTRPGHYDGVNLTFHAGEIVGLTGLEGSGPGALVRGLFGLEELGQGASPSTASPSKPAAPSPRSASASPICHATGMAWASSASAPFATTSRSRCCRSCSAPSGSWMLRRSRPWCGTTSTASASRRLRPRRMSKTLSGGNQQKVVVAKLAATEPRMFFLDEPTQGVDVQAKVEILRIVDELSKRGVAIGVVSDELSELMDICDRIVVFYRGRIACASSEKVRKRSQPSSCSPPSKANSRRPK